jgi:hypothetical protein
MSDHPIRTLLAQTAEGHIPSLNEIAALGLPDQNRNELETAVAELEHQPDTAKAAATAERLINRLPAGFEADDYQDGDSLSPRDLAARLPQA